MAIPPQLAPKALLTPLLFFNLAVYLVLLGFGGWAYNKKYHGLEGNSVTADLITYSLIAGVIGAASTLSGLNYVTKWSPESKASAIASSIIAAPLSLLALGIASKYVHVGDLHDKKLTTLASYAIIAGVTQLLYTLLVHGIFGEEHFIGTAPAPATTPSAPAAATEETPKEAPPAEEPPAEKPAATGEAAV